MFSEVLSFKFAFGIRFEKYLSSSENSIFSLALAVGRQASGILCSIPKRSYLSAEAEADNQKVPLYHMMTGYSRLFADLSDWKLDLSEAVKSSERVAQYVYCIGKFCSPGENDRAEVPKVLLPQPFWLYSHAASELQPQLMRCLNNQP